AGDRRAIVGHAHIGVYLNSAASAVLLRGDEDFSQFAEIEVIAVDARSQSPTAERDVGGLELNCRKRQVRVPDCDPTVLACAGGVKLERHAGSLVENPLVDDVARTKVAVGVEAGGVDGAGELGV